MDARHEKESEFFPKNLNDLLAKINWENRSSHLAAAASGMIKYLKRTAQ